MLIRQFLLEWKLHCRDRGALVWNLAFPVLLLAALGAFFGSGKAPRGVLVVTAPAWESPAGKALVRALEGTPVETRRMEAADARAKWLKGETAALLEGEGDDLQLKVNVYLASQGQLTAQIAQEANLACQIRREGREPRLLPVTQESPAHRRADTYVAFLLPGLLGVNLMSLGFFGLGLVDVSSREKGKYRRLAVTPLPKWVFLGAQVLHRLTRSAAQVALLLLAGHFGFGISNQGSYLLLAGILALGAACFMCMGFALAGFARTSESYTALANSFFLPMMVLSGVYFALDSVPSWMQLGVRALPLSPFLKALRAVFNDGGGLSGQGPGLAIVAAWTLVSFLVAVKRFRWA